jgi:hypothetical protein
MEYRSGPVPLGVATGRRLGVSGVQEWFYREVQRRAPEDIARYCALLTQQREFRRGLLPDPEATSDGKAR